jgi:hypothetical protein
VDRVVVNFTWFTIGQPATCSVEWHITPGGCILAVNSVSSFWGALQGPVQGFDGGGGPFSSFLEESRGMFKFGLAKPYLVSGWKLVFIKYHKRLSKIFVVESFYMVILVY